MSVLDPESYFCHPVLPPHQNNERDSNPLSKVLCLILGKLENSIPNYYVSVLSHEMKINLVPQHNNACGFRGDKLRS